MDQRSQEILAEILAKDPKDLNQDEILFLRGRRDYLKESQKQEYASVINPPKKDDQTSEQSEPVKEDGKPDEK